MGDVECVTLSKEGQKKVFLNPYGSPAGRIPGFGGLSRTVKCTQFPPQMIVYYIPQN